MQGGRKRCAECGRAQSESPSRETSASGLCAGCGAPVDDGALSEFVSRLARFGLGATRQPLLPRTRELPDAK